MATYKNNNEEQNDIFDINTTLQEIMEVAKEVEKLTRSEEYEL